MLTACTLLLALLGCQVVDMVKEQISGTSADPVAEADSLLATGDVPGAIAGYEAALASDPTNVEAAVGVAYGAYLADDLGRADEVLASAEANAGERLGEIKLRRALVALASGDDSLRDHAEASGLPAGTLLVAELALADGEQEEAVELLTPLRDAAGPVGDAADGYLTLLEDPDPSVAGLAENYALWALGERSVAVRSVEEVVKAMPEDSDRKATELLIWAGRAVSEGETQVASNLLEAISFPPPGQAWRVMATRAIITCADVVTEDSTPEDCLAGFAELEGKAPADGLLHARATAAMLSGDGNLTAQLLPEHPNAASAMAALNSGDAELARQLAPSGLLAEHIGR
jgi:hypothetical protein